MLALVPTLQFSIVLQAVTVCMVSAETAILRNRLDIRENEYISKSKLHTCIFATREQNLASLNKFLIDHSNPNSSEYGHVLSRPQVAELTSNFAATDAVVMYLKSQHIKVLSISRYGEFVAARASIQAWENVFSTTFKNWTQSDSSGDDILHFVRALDYSIPSAIEKSVHFVLNTVQMPLRIQNTPVSSSSHRYVGKELGPVVTVGFSSTTLLTAYGT